MAKFVNPILFSHYFGVDPDALDQAGLVDPFLNVDLPLFIDPILLPKSSTPQVSVQGYQSFIDHFGNFIKLLKHSKREETRRGKVQRSF